MSKDTQQHGGALDGLKRNSLKVGGYSYMAGDLALAAGKALQKDYAGAAGVGLWFLGGLACALFGNPSPDRQTKIMERRLGGFLKKQGIDLSGNPDLAEMMKEDGIVDKLQNFLFAHPSEVLNAVYAIGSIGVIKGGAKKLTTSLEERRNGQQTPINYESLASGILVLAGSLAGLLISEKKPDPKNRATTFTGKVQEWAHEKPLRVPGLMFGANNFFLAKDTWNEYQGAGEAKTALDQAIAGGSTEKLIGEKRKALNTGRLNYTSYGLTTLFYIFANGLLTVSSKDNLAAQGVEKDQLLEAMSNKSKQIALSLPAHQQDELLLTAAAFLSSQSEIKKSTDEIFAIFKADLEQAKQAQKQPAAAAPANWQDRMAAASLAPASPTL